MTAASYAISFVCVTTLTVFGLGELVDSAAAANAMPFLNFAMMGEITKVGVSGMHAAVAGSVLALGVTNTALKTTRDWVMAPRTALEQALKGYQAGHSVVAARDDIRARILEGQKPVVEVHKLRTLDEFADFRKLMHHLRVFGPEKSLTEIVEQTHLTAANINFLVRFGALEMASTGKYDAPIVRLSRPLRSSGSERHNEDSFKTLHAMINRVQAHCATQQWLIKGPQSMEALGAVLRNPQENHTGHYERLHLSCMRIYGSNYANLLRIQANLTNRSWLKHAEKLGQELQRREQSRLSRLFEYFGPSQRKLRVAALSLA